MGDIGEDWRAFNDASKIHRGNKQEWAKELLQEWCERDEVQLKEIQPWHIRLTKDKLGLDIYPQKQRAFDLNTKQWSTYKDLEEIYKTKFNILPIDNIGNSTELDEFFNDDPPF